MLLFGIHTSAGLESQPCFRGDNALKLSRLKPHPFLHQFLAPEVPLELPQDGCHLMPYVLESLGRLVGGCAELGDAKSPNADAGPTSGRSAALDSPDDELSERAIDHIFSRGQARAIQSRRLGINS